MGYIIMPNIGEVTPPVNTITDGTGATTIDELNDSIITNPISDDILIYNSGNDKWENLPSTKKFSGYTTILNTISTGTITDATIKNIPLTNLVIDTTYFDHSDNTTDIKFLTDDTYLIVGKVSFKSSINVASSIQTFIELDTGSGFNAIDVSFSWSYTTNDSDQTCTNFSFIMDFNTNDIIRLAINAYVNPSSAILISNGTILTITKI